MARRGAPQHPQWWESDCVTAVARRHDHGGGQHGFGFGHLREAPKQRCRAASIAQGTPTVTASLITIAGGTHDFWNAGLPLPSDGRSRQRNRQRPSTYNATAHNRRKSLEREAGGRVQFACLSPAAVSAPAAVAIPPPLSPLSVSTAPHPRRVGSLQKSPTVGTRVGSLKTGYDGRWLVCRVTLRMSARKCRPPTKEGGEEVVLVHLRGHTQYHSSQLHVAVRKTQ